MTGIGVPESGSIFVEEARFVAFAEAVNSVGGKMRAIGLVSCILFALSISINAVCSAGVIV